MIVGFSVVLWTFVVVVGAIANTQLPGAVFVSKSTFSENKKKRVFTESTVFIVKLVVENVGISEKATIWSSEFGQFWQVIRNCICPHFCHLFCFSFSNSLSFTNTRGKFINFIKQLWLCWAMRFFVCILWILKWNVPVFKHIGEVAINRSIVKVYLHFYFDHLKITLLHLNAVS